MEKKDSGKVTREDFLDDESDEKDAEGKAADREFWHERFEKYRPELFCYACRLTNSTVDQAEDILQETACRLEKYCPKQDEVAAVKPYLYLMVRNAWVDSISKKALISIDDPNFSPDQIKRLVVDPKAHQTLENRDLLDFIGKGLESPEHEIFQMWREGRSDAEIAERCGICKLEVKLAKARIKDRARNKLKRTHRQTPDMKLPDIKRTGNSPQQSRASLVPRARKRR